jgi:anti-sigma factor RsiW
MTCRDLDDRIEALAAGDEPQSTETRAHLDGCVRCQAAFARAVQIERLLAARPAPPAPPRFATAVSANLRRERWESEQSLDRWFNLIVAASVVLAAGGLLLLANVSGMAAVGAETGRILREGMGVAAARLAADLPTYIVATGIVFTTVAIWWWAEEN